MSMIIDGTSGATFPDLSVQAKSQTGPAFSAYSKTAQSIPTSSFTKIQFNVENFDTANAYDSTTNYRFQPLVAGYYQLNACVAGGGGTVGYVQCYFQKNTVTQIAAGSSVPNNSLVGGKVAASCLVYLNGSTDYVEFTLWQNQGTAINLQTADGDNVFSGFLARAA